MIEVEFKYPVISLGDIREQFLRLGALPESVTTQVDEYLNDPLRDFATMDVALRIRGSDDEYCVTFKGPNLDPTAKIREEIEMPLIGEDAARQMKEVFKGIGFYSVAKVVKRREELILDWDGEKVHVCLDDVVEVGGFVELELVVEDETKMMDAKRKLEELANEAGLHDAIRTSYLELLLKQRGDLK